MSPTLNTHEVLAHLDALIERETQALVASEEGGDRRRGRIDMLKELAIYARGPDPTTITPTADYGFGSDAGVPYT